MSDITLERCGAHLFTTAAAGSWWSCNCGAIGTTYDNVASAAIAWSQHVASVVTRSARPHLPLCTCERCKAERPVNP